MAYPYIVQSDLEARLGAQRVRDILDDDNNGLADPAPVARILADASAKVAGVLRGIYDLTVIASAPPEEVKRLALDVAVVYAAQRHPEVVRRDWQPLLKAVTQDLEDLRTGMLLPGIVTNITNFGVFVDIGVKQDGLVHISQLANTFVKNPTDVVSLQQEVLVKVLDVDLARKRVNLSMKEASY